MNVETDKDKAIQHAVNLSLWIVDKMHDTLEKTYQDTEEYDCTKQALIHTLRIMKPFYLMQGWDQCNIEIEWLEENWHHACYCGICE